MFLSITLEHDSFDSHSHNFFKIIDKADLKIKMTLHIDWKKPNLNAQQNLSL